MAVCTSCSWRSEEKYLAFLLRGCIHRSLSFWAHGTGWGTTSQQRHAEEMLKAPTPPPQVLYLTEEGEDALMFLQELGNGEAALLDAT